MSNLDRTPAPRRPQDFDLQLQRAARALADAELPADLLLQPLSGQPTSAARLGGLAALMGPMAAAMALLVVVGVALWAGGLQVGRSGPQFHPSPAIRAALAAAGYRCGSGGPAAGSPSVALVTSPPSAVPTPRPTAGPIEAFVCFIPLDREPVRAAVFALEQPRGRIVEIVIKGDVNATLTPERLATLFDTFAELVRAATTDVRTGEEITAWLESLEPSLSPGASFADTIDGIHVTVEAAAGASYALVMEPTDD
jgi:hypothetical protein